MCWSFDFASLESGFQCSLHRFAAAHDTVGIKISTVKTDMPHVSRNTNHRWLQLNGATQKQVYKFKYLRVAFTTDGRQNKELGIPVGKAIAIMKVLHYSVVMKRFSSCETKIVKNKAKALNFRNSICPFLPTPFLYGDENSLMIKRVRLQKQASKMRFLQKIKAVTSLTGAHI